MLRDYIQKTPLQKKLLAAFGLLFIAIILFATTLIKDINELQTASRWVNHTHNVIAKANNLIKLMVDQETGLRGYLLVGKENFLEPFYSGKTNFEYEVKELQKTVSDNPSQVTLLKEVEELAQQWHLKTAKPEIALWRDETNSTIRAQKITKIVESEVGKTLMDKMRKKIEIFVRNEQILIHQRKLENEQQHQKTYMLATFGAFLVVFLGLFTIIVINRTSRPLMELISEMRAISESSDFTRRVEATGMYEVNRIAEVFNRMALNTEQQAWLKSNALEISRVLQEAKDSVHLAEQLTSKMGEILGSGFGAFYLYDRQKDQFELLGSYRFKERKHAVTSYKFGEGLIGQCALEKTTMVLTGVPENYTTIHSGLGEAIPDSIIAIPIVFNDQTMAVIEMATFGHFSQVEQGLIEDQVPNIALGLRSLLNSLRTKELLEETQAQAEELQVREEELNDSNAVLERQAKELQESQIALEQSNKDLTAQQEELRVANEELEEKANDLNASQVKLEEQNLSLEDARKELEKRADDLAVSSKYKSEFLANMSHELRTPLNSLLILSKLLMDNKEGNLNSKQIDYAKTVHDSGEDLLNLINDILDLSKIESGRMEVMIEDIRLEDFISGIEKKFAPMAEKKGIALNINPTTTLKGWRSDGQKLNQIIKNLLSNAIKFTSSGEVSVSIGNIPDSIKVFNKDLSSENALAIAVKDSGIGIPEEKRHIIFEAFQQADGTTSRKYGGTGLGLSISRELANLLQGEIHLESEPGKGSTFTLVIPTEMMADTTNNQQTTPTVSTHIENNKDITDSIPEKAEEDISVSEPLPEASQLEDDRDSLTKGDKSLLIVEDDPRFANIAAEVAKERGFGVLLAPTGKSGIQLANEFQPSGIILDIGLPDLSGWEVMKHLKSAALTRHIPIHVMSASDRNMDALKGGAIGFYTKPVSLPNLEQAFQRIENLNQQPVKRLLIVEDDETQLASLQELLGGSDVEIQTACTGQQAEELIAAQAFDCIVLDLGLPDINGLQLLETLRTKPEIEQIPVVVYSGRELDPKERETLDKYAQSVIIKNAKSPERLLDDTTLFLHRVEEDLPTEQRQTIQMLHDTEKLFEGKKVLLVDDDMRNIFSLSAVLQEKNLEIITAANGKESLEQLKKHPDVALVLMDIMMPEMDGYEAMQHIRKQEQFASLPIIALTAKAMKGDRTQCIQAGASDYLSKPVDTEKLLSMMRVWLYQ